MKHTTLYGSFSSALDAQIAINMIVGFAFRRGCSIPTMEIKKENNLFVVYETANLPI